MGFETNTALAACDPSVLFKNARQFECHVNGKPYDVYELYATEELFSLHTVTVTLLSERCLERAGFLGKAARVRLKGRTSQRCFHGIVSRCEELPERRTSYLYTLTLVPELWHLTQMQNVRIFQVMSVPEILEEILKESRILPERYTMNFQARYPKREYCVQYRETNWDFIQRIMAEEGIYFYHEFCETSSVCVFTDSPAFLKNIPGASVVIYSRKGQLVNFEDHITALDATDRLAVEAVHLADYDFKCPSHPPAARAEAEERQVPYAIYDYPGYLDDEPSEYRLAQVRLQRETWKKRIFRGEGVCRTLIPGHTFTLSGHSNPECNVEYMVSAVVHQGRQPQVLKELEESDQGTTYGNTFTCIPAKTPFRPGPLPKPSVRGVQSAVVTGPPNEEIYVDEWGRIKIKFHWDLLGQEERTSCWVRVSQIWAGACETIFTPRVGQEVLVDFIDGDPDRPVVIGTLFNGRNIPPYTLPQNKTRSTIKTRTVKGEGFNELRFEDLKGSEEIYIHGQKDWNIEILNDKGQTIGHDERLEVNNDRAKTVGHDQKEEVKNDKTITVGKNHSESIGETMSVTIGKNGDETIGEDKTVEVGKNFSHTIGEDADIHVKGNETVDIGKNHKKTIAENSSGDVGKDMTVRVGGNAAFTADKNISASAQDHVTVTSGKNFSITSSGGDVIIRAGDASVIITKNGDIKLDGVNVSVKASGKITMDGTNINQN